MLYIVYFPFLQAELHARQATALSEANQNLQETNEKLRMGLAVALEMLEKAGHGALWAFGWRSNIVGNFKAFLACRTLLADFLR